jgi:TolA-binding protein
VLSGCATKADVRDLQQVVEASAQRQAEILSRLELDLAMTADSLQRGQSQGRVELQGTVLTRLNEIAARLDRLEALIGYVGDELATVKEGMRANASRPVETNPAPVSVMPPPGGFPGEQSADQLLAQALDDYAGGSLATAKMEFDAFLADFPDDPRVPEARYRRALILRETDDPEVALTAFQEIPQLHPDDRTVPLALLEIAELHVQLGDAGDARDVLRRMINTYPGHDLESRAQRLLRQIGGNPSSSNLSGAGGG